MKETHVHVKPKRKDFVGKTVSKFRRDAENCWRIWFTDGTSFAIQSNLRYGLAVMDICKNKECVAR